MNSKILVCIVKYNENELKEINKKICDLEVELKNVLQRLAQLEKENVSSKSEDIENTSKTLKVQPGRQSLLTINNKTPSRQSFGDIPQLDGPCMELDESSFKCDNCLKSFRDQNELNEHLDEVLGCDRCDGCFETDFDWDVHDHSFHPQDYWSYNTLTPKTKHQAIRRLNEQLGFT